MRTPQLYDPGEEGWGLKLHLGCGSIYLTGYVNVDIAGFHPYERPDLVETNRTTIDDYYGRKEDGSTLDGRIPPSIETVVDLLTDMRDLPYVDQVDKIVCIQALEHTTRSDADRALLSWYNALKPGGIVIISVPDPEKTAELLLSDDNNVKQFALRHLVGSGVNTYALHYYAYSRSTLRSLLEGHGFGQIEELPNFHFYPAIVVKARKQDVRCKGREYQVLPAIDPAWTVLDVGPGKFPLACATHYADVTEENRNLLEGKPFHLIRTAESLPFADDQFDFVYCSHVLEHTDSPVRAFDEIYRVGKRGYIEVPSVMLDFMMQHGETHPKWACWQSGSQSIVFLRKTQEQNRVFTDPTVGAFFHGTVHTTTKLTAYERGIRFFFWRNQQVLNICMPWSKDRGKPKITEVVYNES